MVVGSVTTSQGSVTTGNTGGDTTVLVNVGDVASSGTVTITFDVTLNSTIAPSDVEVCNQGTATGGNFSAVSSGDPDEVGAGDPDDPTCTPVGPFITATKVDSMVAGLANDVDSDGVADPGDTIDYTIVLTNNGVTATGITFTDPVSDPNLNYVAASANITPGGAGTPSDVAGGFQVVIPTLNPGQSVTINFQATVDAATPQGTTEVCNQGTVSYGSSNDQTGDPDELGVGDPVDATCSPLDFDADVSATKSLVFNNDIDGDGQGKPRRRIDLSSEHLEYGNT